MNGIQLTIELEAPLLLTGMDNKEENSAVSMRYIPGSVIRGAVIAQYLKANPTKDLAGDRESRALFFENRLFFLNGYLANPLDLNARALPVPLSWHIEKGSGEDENREIRDYVLTEEPFESGKREGSTYFWQSIEVDNPIYVKNPRIMSNVHNTSFDPMLKKEGNSNVFRYEAMDKGQKFSALILSKDDELIAAIEPYLDVDHLFLGRSQSAGYGLATWRAKRVDDVEEAEIDYAIKDFTVITLLSDVILKDRSGRTHTNFPKALSCEIELPNLELPVQTYAQTKLVGGFNRKWGLPLPQEWAISMGSTFVYDSTLISPDDLMPILSKGIGERREDGFGRIGVNIHGRDRFHITNPKRKLSQPEPLSHSSKIISTQLSERALLLDARNKILNAVKGMDLKNSPHNAQLSQLRIVVRQAQQNDDLSLIPTHLKSLRQTGLAQFKNKKLNATGGSIRWDKWLNETATQNNGFKQIGLDLDDQQYQIAGNGSTNFEKVKTKITLNLLEAVLKRALREKEDEPLL